MASSRRVSPGGRLPAACSRCVRESWLRGRFWPRPKSSRVAPWPSIPVASSPSCASSRSSRATRTAPSGSRGRTPGTPPARGSTGSSTASRSSASATQPATTGGRCAANPSRAVLIGGHIDSVPNGGWLDGCLNVVAGAEVLRRIAEQGTPPVTIRLVNWADEEGARFGRSLFGSSAAGGSMSDQDELRQLTDRDGISLPDALAANGVDLDRALEARSQLELGRGLPRAPHRAGAGARVDGHSPRCRARHLRRRALAHHVDGPGRARRLDADGQAPRRARRRGEARARAARDRRPGGERRRLHLGRRRLPARDRHLRRRDRRAAPRPAPPRRRQPGRAAPAGAGGERALRRRGEPRGRPGSGSGTSSRSCSTRR